MSKFQIEGSTALITGASAGLGSEFARQLAGRAGSLVLVARRQERLEELREELAKRDPSLNVHIRATDLSDERSVSDLGDWLDREQIAIHLLINNAGLGDLGHFATIELQRVKEMLAVNVTALTVLTRLLLPGMVARKRGAILNVSSSAGFLPLAGFAVYAATKSYVTSFSEAIRAELRGTGVTVTALCPGPVHTEFAETARRSVAGAPKTVPGLSHVSAQEVVRTGLAAVEKGRALAIPGFIMKLGMTLVRMTPMPVLRLASRFTAKRS
jgi:short-subunit dehydrogenase